MNQNSISIPISPEKAIFRPSGDQSSAAALVALALRGRKILSSDGGGSAYFLALSRGKKFSMTQASDSIRQELNASFLPSG